MKQYQEYYVSAYDIENRYHGKLSDFFKQRLLDKEHVISVVANYNSYGSVSSYRIYTEIEIGTKTD